MESTAGDKRVMFGVTPTLLRGIAHCINQEKMLIQSLKVEAGNLEFPNVEIRFVPLEPNGEEEGA